MVAASQDLITPRDLARVVFRHWRKMAIFAAAAVGVTLFAIALWPRSYRSEAKLFLRIGRESVALDPTATTGETIMLQKTQADEVNSAVNLLMSREVLRQAVEKVGAERINRNSAKDHGRGGEAAISLVSSLSGWLKDALAMIRLADPGTPEDVAIRRLERRIKLTAPKESTVITLQYTAATPELAQEVVAAVTDAFLAEHVRLSHTEGSLKFFAEQNDKLFKELTTAQAELSNQMSAFQMTTVGTRRSILEKEEEAMRQKLYELEMQENDLKSRYTDAYPTLREVRRQRADTEKRLTEIVASRREMVAGDVSKADSPERAKLLDELKSVNEQELQIAQLQREVDLLEKKYRMHNQKLEEARLNDAMARGAISNVKVAQAATLVQKPVSPNKAIFLGLGVLTAVVGSIGLAFALESMDQTLRTTGQVEAQLGLPVLLSLPEPKRRQSRAHSENGAIANGNGMGRKGNGVGDGNGRTARFRGLAREFMSNVGEGEDAAGRHARTVGVVGCESSKMRSRVAANLAIQAAASGAEPVLLIDADPRNRRVTKRFHINGSPGLREMISGAVDAASCIHKQDVKNLSVMSPGKPNGSEPSKSTPVLGPAQLEEIRSDYGLVVVDLPADRDMEAAPAAKWLDETLLVVEAERTRIQSAQRAKEQLERAGVRVTGVVLANRREHIPNWLYQRL